MKYTHLIQLLLYFTSNLCSLENNDNRIAPDLTMIKNIIIFSPASVTGGPEALCQLSYELTKIGHHPHIFWTTFDYANTIQRIYKNNRWYLCKQNFDASPSVFLQKYKTKYVDFDVPLDQSTLIIIPEIWGNLIALFQEAHIGFYWLSIDGFYAKFSDNYRSLLFEKKSDPYNCIHLSDAPWISKKLQEWGLTSYLLEAPISNHYFSTPKIKQPTNSIVYNPVKGADLAKSFIHLYPMHHYVPLKNMDEQGVINALDAAKIYIDFGNFPGKDRIPREALSRDCVIFIHNAGCATDFDSFPIDDYFRFSETDIINGTLHDKIIYTFNNYEEMHCKQAYAKDSINKESEKFQQQVKNLFGSAIDNIVM